MNIENLPKNKTYLVDMDGVLAAYYAKFLEKWREHYPEREFILEEELKEHDLEHSYPEKYLQDINKIREDTYFFNELEPIKYALEGIQELAKYNTVFICTAPSVDNLHSAHGKTMWIREHLGKDWLRRTIITKDKTLVHGDYLIDDKPHIKGVNKPTWEHILYDQPYNRGKDQQHKKRMTWEKGLFS